MYIEFDFQVKAINVPDHTFPIVIIKKKKIDVETTQAGGFNSNNRYKDREEITIMRLIAFVFDDDSISNPYEGLAIYKKSY